MSQANGPFEHETRLKELLGRQAQLNAALDLDKSDTHAVEPATEPLMETPLSPGSVTSGDETRKDPSEIPEGLRALSLVSAG